MKVRGLSKIKTDFTMEFIHVVNNFNLTGKTPANISYTFYMIIIQ